MRDCKIKSFNTFFVVQNKFSTVSLRMENELQHKEMFFLFLSSGNVLQERMSVIFRCFLIFEIIYILSHCFYFNILIFTLTFKKIYQFSLFLLCQRNFLIIWSKKILEKRKIFSIILWKKKHKYCFIQESTTLPCFVRICFHRQGSQYVK